MDKKEEIVGDKELSQLALLGLKAAKALGLEKHAIAFLMAQDMKKGTEAFIENLNETRPQERTVCQDINTGEVFEK